MQEVVVPQEMELQQQLHLHVLVKHYLEDFSIQVVVEVVLTKDLDLVDLVELAETAAEAEVDVDWVLILQQVKQVQIILVVAEEHVDYVLVVLVIMVVVGL